MVLQEMKVRKNSKDLRPVATPQAASCAAADATGLEQQMGFKMSTLMLEQSKALDALKHEMELSKTTLPRASSSHSLSSADVSPHTSSFLSSKALDTHPDPLPLPAPAGPEASGHGDLAGNPAQKDALVKMTLEDYENEAKQRLSNKKAKELDEEMTTMKRPASKKVGKAQPKGKVTKQKGVLKEKKQQMWSLPFWKASMDAPDVEETFEGAILAGPLPLVDFVSAAGMSTTSGIRRSSSLITRGSENISSYFCLLSQ